MTALLTFLSGFGVAADAIEQGGYAASDIAASALLPAATAAGRTPGAFGVTSTGAATYSIPIWTPPGVGNVDLKLALEYNSRFGSGVIGQGWALSGLSEISRCNRTFAQDGAPGAVTHTVADRFCLDRQQLKLVSGTYGAVGSVYATEIESFSRVSAVASAYGVAFVVTTKNGLVYEYGTSADSVIVDAASGVARTWALSRIHDRMSPTPNQISLRYSNDAVGSQNNIGTYRIASITYPTTASGLGPFYQVDFGYSARPANDAVVGYLAGSIVREPNKLDTITIRPYGSGGITKSYNLAYTQGPTTHRLLLSSVTECSASSCMRPTTISYKSGSGSWAAVLNTGVNASGAAAPIPVDLNGDGRDDLVYPRASGSANSRWCVMLATATGFGAPIDTGLTTANDKKVLVAPFSGQGKAQLLMVQAGYWNVVTYTGTAFSSSNTGVPASGEFTAVDWDGDGLPDLVSVEPIPDAMAITGWAIRVRRNLTTPPGAVAFSTTTFTLWTSPPGYVGANAGTANAVADFNGDGRADVLIGYMPDTYPPIHYFALLSNGFGSAPTVAPLPDDLTPGLMADFNADGCTDFYSNPVLMSNCAGGFNQVTPGAFPVGYGTSYAVADENGDGRADILYTSWTDKKWYVIRSTGDGFAAAVNLGIAAPDGTVWFVLDQNGDGLTDLALRDDTNSGRLKYLLHNAAAAPADLAVSFTDGLGITQSAAYASIAQSNYSKNAGAVFPEIDIQRPLFVVSQANVNGNSSGAFQQQFYYSGARVHLQGRGFEGFAARRTYDSRNDLYEVDSLTQTFPYTGMRLQHTLLRNNLTTRVSDSSATLAVQALGNAGAQQRFFPYAQGVTDSQYELGGALNGVLVSQAVTSFSFGDGFGNPTLISRTVTDKDPGSPYFATSWTTTTSATYYNNASTNCLGLPQTIAESRTAPGKAAMTRTIAYGADTVTCRITQQTLEPGAPEQKVTTTLEFDVCGNTNALRVVGARWDGVALPERATRIDYGSRCQLPESVTNPLGEVRRIGYRYEFGVPSSMVDGNGLVTSWQHDDFGRRISESRPDGTATTWAFDSCATQNCMGASAPYQRFHEHEVSIGGQANVYDQRDRYYDGRETLQLQTYTLPLGVTASDRFVYDGFGRVTSRYAPASLQSNGYTMYAYDAVGRLQSIKLYNSNGALDRITTIAHAGRTTTVIDPLGHTRSAITDVAGQLRQVIDPSPGGTTIYDYDSIGNRTLIQDPIGAVSSGTYNQRSFRLTWTDADSGSWAFKTDSLGELVGWTDAKGQSFSASYDALGRMTSRTEPEGVATWTWGNSAPSHNIGRLWKKSGYGYVEELTYDGIGRPATRKISTDQAYQYDYSYNSIGAVDTISYPSSPVPSGQTGTRFKARYYYSFGGPVSITDASDAAEKPLWALTGSNAYGSATSESIGGVATVTSGYKAWTNELTSSQVGQSTTTDRQNLSYQWDNAGNLIQRQDLNQSIFEAFQFDSLNRLTGSTRNGASSLTVDYDASGNISRKSDVGATTYSYSDSAHPHAVTAAGSRTFTYDANGNQKTRDGVAQTWASFNLPTALAQPIGGTTYTTQFNYGPDHQRWKQVANYSNGVETTQYLGGLLEKETTTSTGKTYWRHYVDTPSGMVVVSRVSDASISTRFVVSDHLGSSDAVLDDSGNPVVRASYGAFGARRGSDWTSTTPPDWPGIANSTRHGYTGHEHLDNVNLIHMGGRVYDPVVGRFLSVDPLIGDDSDSQSVNPYAYVGNRPLTATDPTGYAGDSGGRPHGGFGFDWIGSLLAFMPQAKPYYPPASTLPGISVQSGGGICGPGTLTAQCGGCFLSASGAGTQQSGVPTSTWSGQDSEDAQALARENIYRLFVDLGVNAVDVIILAPYHDGRESYDAFRDQRYGAAAVYLGFTVCDIECKQLSVIFKPLVKAGKGLRSVEKAAVESGGTEVVQRAMSRAELDAMRSTGLVRGGRGGTHYVSDSVSSTATRAQQRLALPKRPDVRVTIEVPAGRFSAPSRIEPLVLENGRVLPGGGMERTATGDVPARILRVDDL